VKKEEGKSDIVVDTIKVGVGLDHIECGEAMCCWLQVLKLLAMRSSRRI
jgi:aspartate carbamoyltransferase regulatory subunit